jgi:hypothetical protein
MWCPGRRAKRGKKKRQRELAGDQYVDACTFWSEDEPSTVIASTADKAARAALKYGPIDFYGFVVDVCQNDTVQQVAKMRLDFRSKSGAWKMADPWAGDLTEKPLIALGVAGEPPPTQPMVELKTQNRKPADPHFSPMPLNLKEVAARRNPGDKARKPAVQR